MFKEERLNAIRQSLEKNGRVNVRELAQQFNVSRMTIRRDLEELSDSGMIERTYGGAIAPYQPHKFLEPPFTERVNSNAQEKALIAREASQLVRPGDKIFLSAGTTAYMLAKELARRSNFTVVMNSILIASVIATNENIRALVLGGFVRHSELSLHGHLTQEGLKGLHLDKVFIGIRGIHPEYGLSNDTPWEVMTDRGVLSVSDQIIVLADHTKFGHVATNVIAPLEKVNTLITSTLTPSEMIEKIRSRGVNVIQVNYP